jgi:hypothetical protein
MVDVPVVEHVTQFEKPGQNQGWPNVTNLSATKLIQELLKGHKDTRTHTHTHTYTCVCMCVCVCARTHGSLSLSKVACLLRPHMNYCYRPPASEQGK